MEQQKTVEYWHKWLTDRLTEYKQMDEENTAAELLASVFDITTYDGDMDLKFVEMILEVLEVLATGATHTYIENPKNYRRFLTTVNFPFIKDMLGWGVSIRGAWLEETFDEPYDPGDQLARGKGTPAPIIAGKADMIEFVKACRLLLAGGPPATEVV